MSPIESGEKSPEINVKQLEEKLVKGIKLLKEKKSDCSHKDIKDFVRFFLTKEYESFGIESEQEALSMAPYFMRLAYPDHKEADKMWEHLCNLSSCSKNPAAATQISTEILETTTGGITPMWHLIEKIIKGELTVEQKETSGGKIYSIGKLPTEEEKNDPKRNQLANYIEEKFKDLIKQRPALKIDQDVLGMSKHDEDLFLKIPRFMLEDSEAIVNSQTLHPIIEEYFEGVANHLSSTFKRLDIESAKSDARKIRLKQFITYIFQHYLKQLMGYCKSLANDRNQKNQFASDIIFEHYLASNNLLTKNNKEPEYTVIEKRWKDLFMEIKRHVQDNATLYMKALDTASPVEQVQTIAQDVQRQSASAINQTIIGIATPTLPVTPTRPVIALETPGQDERKKLEKADTMIAVINKEAREHRRLESSARLAYPYIAVVPGSVAEKELIEAIKNDIDRIFMENANEIKSTKCSKDFVDRLNKIARNRASTKNSIGEFISRVISNYRKLTTCLKKEESDNVFENISALFDAIGSGLTFPSGIISKKKPVEEKIKIAMPQAHDIDFSIADMPSINPSSVEFENLKKFLKEKGLYERFLEIETTLKNEMIIKDVKNMGAFEDLNTKFLTEESFKEAFIDYYSQKRKFIEDAIEEVEKLTGNWFTKHFKLGRTKQVKEELAQYALYLKRSINQTWDSVLSPAILQYGKIIFGSDLYVQKT